MDHYTDSYPTLQESNTLEENAEKAIPLPFPQRAIQPNKKFEETDKEIMETFKKVEVNIPLLDAIKQMPRYAKFLKDLCTNRRRLKGNERVNMGRNVFALFEKQRTTMPEKCKDLGTFTIPCTIGNNIIDNAMLDLEASINVMLLSIFTSLSLGPLQSTSVIIQLTNRNTTHPAGLVEDVLVWTARTKIDVHTGTLIMEFGDSVVCFNIMEFGDRLECDAMSTTSTVESNLYDLNVVEILTNGSVKSLPSMKQLPTLELKPLPEHLKYAYLEAKERLAIVISTKLDGNQEKKLLKVIKRHKRAIGWTLTEIPRISPSMYMHRILLEEGAKPVR
ncbi:uncharacterized protein LOC113871611 [Abrus precatorius]|uniref:Uncharacterized protein LOC113871611 n=1 Tax=Abrus precatorius TaxID=3816 RepID=A0A8B8M9M8_ABRPR|nr:uncharacterized protein LOC113871611 [Abrus precatorius]